MKEFDDKQYYQGPPFNPVFTNPHWRMNHEFDIPVVSSVGNGPKGDKGDPLVFDDLTDEQMQKVLQDANYVGNKAEEATYITGSGTTTVIEIPIADFDQFDMLFVDIEGLDLHEGADYDIVGNNIVLNTPITHSGAKVHFKALSYTLIDGNKTIQNIMGHHDYDTVATMKLDTDIELGAICHTLGFNAKGDKGAAWYKVVDDAIATETDVISLDNGYYAIMYKDDESVNPEMLGVFDYTLAEWAGTTHSYSKRTVVYWGSSAYTARQDVPTGIQITNTEYWVPWVNNEALHLELERIDNNLNTEIQARETADNAINAKIASYCNIMNYGAKEMDATIDWQSIIDEIAAIPNNDTIYFPAGKWYISEPLVIPSTIFKVIGTFAEIIAQDTMTTMMTMQAESAGEINRIEGVHFYCNNNAANCLEVTTTSTHTTVNNCKFRDFTGFGCKCNYIGTIVQNCEFVSDHNTADTIGLDCLTDVVVTGSKFYYCSIAVMGSSVTATGNYIWGGRANKKSIAFASRSDSTVMTLNCIANELDACISFFKNVCGNVSNNRILVNLSDIVYTDEPITMFESLTNYAHTYSTMVFNGNEVRYIGPSNFNRDIFTFVQSPTTANFCFKCFESENNQIFIDNRNTNAIYVHYGFGLAMDSVRPLIGKLALKVALYNGKTTFNGFMEYNQANTTQVHMANNADATLMASSFVNTASKRPVNIEPVTTINDHNEIYFTTFHEHMATKLNWCLGTYFEFLPYTDESTPFTTDAVTSTNNFVAVLAS